jgi:hypothetical protein
MARLAGAADPLDSNYGYMLHGAGPTHITPLPPSGDPIVFFIHGDCSTFYTVHIFLLQLAESCHTSCKVINTEQTSLQLL